MTTETVFRIIRMYGLEPKAVRPMLSGYRNESYPVELADGRLVNLILHKREAGAEALIARVHNLTAYLAARGLPVRSPVDSRVVQIRDRSARVGYAALYTFLPGSTIPWEAYTKEHLKLLGQSLAGLHAALAGYHDPGLPSVAGDYNQIVQRMRRYFASKPVREAMAAKVGLQVSGKVFTRLQHILKMCEKLGSRQALHMDFVRGNVLFNASPAQVAGILDFEKAAVGHPLFDVARTLAFLLVDCKYKPEAKVRKYFLGSGYQKRGGLRLGRVMVKSARDDRPLLEMLVDLFLVYDFYKFLRHNPYESLADNEHFVRTRDLLLKRDVITTTDIGSQP